MKKILILFSSLALVFCFIGCNNSKSNEDSKTVARQFINDFYEVKDHEKLDAKKLDFEYPNHEFFQKTKAYTTKEVFDNLIANRYPLAFLHTSTYKKFDINVKTIELKEYTKGKDGYIVYNYTVKLELLYSDDKKEEFEVSGQLTTNEINKEWKITKLNKVTFGKIMEYEKEFIQSK